MVNAGIIVGIVLVGLVARFAIHRGLSAMGLTRAAGTVRNPENSHEFYGLLLLVTVLSVLAVTAFVGGL